MKGIITTNDPLLQEVLKEFFPEWKVLISLNSEVIKFHRLPN